MSRKNTPYVLKREADGQIEFEAAYVKHYFEGYCALFENYPSSNTTVWLCRKLDFADRGYQNNLCVLYRNYPGEDNAVIGHYIFLCEVGSETEANQRMKAEIEGMNFFNSLISGEVAQ